MNSAGRSLVPGTLGTHQVASTSDSGGQAGKAFQSFSSYPFPSTVASALRLCVRNYGTTIPARLSFLSPSLPLFLSKSMSGNLLALRV